ncbi:hypothetical protein K8I28_01190 [bacterium]|nr:hypothetical protein [bacterium]
MAKQLQLKIERSPEELYDYLNDQVEPLIHLTITDNRTRMASYRKEGRLLKVRLHKAFLVAPDIVLDAVSSWISTPRSQPPLQLKKFIESIGAHGNGNNDIPGIPNEQRRRRILYPKGHVHNLDELFDRVNRDYFDGKIKADITYGKNTARQRVQTRRLGSYRHDLNLITIHPVLDQRKVPEDVVAFTIYHEMLHALQPPTTRRPHNAAFRAEEKKYKTFEKVKEWREKNGKLLNGGW